MRRNLEIRTSLSDQTNESEPRLSKEDPPSGSLTPPKGLRRTASFQFGHSRFPSSSTSASDDDDSIYNAQATASEPDLFNAAIDWESRPALATNPPLSWFNEPHPRDDRLFNWLDLQRPRASETRLSTPTKPHSKWPIKKLETITEQRSAATLRPSTTISTLPRQTSQPLTIPPVAEDEPSERLPQSGQSDLQIFGNPVKHSDIRSIAEVPISSRRRCFSLNDLDCLPRLQPDYRRSHEKSWSSSSSSASSFKCSSIFRDLCFFPASPNHPMHPPPVRVQTPPGLPSFGTRDAARYVSPSRQRRARHETPSDSQVPIPNLDHMGSPPRTAPLPLSSTAAMQTRSRAARFFEILAFASPEPIPISDPPPYSSSPGTVPLPPETVFAPDGTRVRGRFSTRHSGHGVGGGGEGWQGLDSHPFHHAPMAEVDPASVTARASWEPQGGPDEPVMTGAIQDFLEAGDGTGTTEGVRERLGESQKRRDEEGWARRCYRWFCMACCAWELDDGTGAVVGREAHGDGLPAGYVADGARMTY